MTGSNTTAFDFIIVGGGPAGCALANRLSARADKRILLVEAGPDTPPDATPEDIAAPYAARAAANPAYLWNGLTAELTPASNRRPALTASYEQARVMGGGSSINGQIGIRGAPQDYDRWEELGAKGWDWASVLPYFRRLERDLDIGGDLHGQDGPIPLQRTPEPEWDGFTRAVTAEFKRQGLPLRDDLNGVFAEGFGAAPLFTFDGKRVSAAAAYLDARTRARPNLELRALTQATRILFNGSRAIAVELASRGRSEVVAGREIILAGGAILSPVLLMRSGIGPGARLRELGIPLVADLRGVGRNLQEHPAIHVSAYLLAAARTKSSKSRHNSVYCRYASELARGDIPDMLLNFACRSSWHAVGRRLATIQAYILQPYSRGSVELRSGAVEDAPLIRMNHGTDHRDMQRLMESFRKAAAIFKSSSVSRIAFDPFATSYSDRVRRVNRVTLRNRLATQTLALILDMPRPVRRLALNRLVNEAPPLDVLLAHEELLEEHVRRTVTGVWHPTGTCRMGRDDDPEAVTDPAGRVRGVAGLRVADNSIIPEIPRANTTLPAIMIGERVADLVLASDATEEPYPSA